jgi:carotenoid cleavage dioxygenase-like enzyme
VHGSDEETRPAIHREATMPDHPMLDRSRFVQGPFAPVAEEVTAFDLPVTGSLPTDLNGRYLRNGPNPLGLDDPGAHWFLGPGMVHGVRLRDGRAEWYRNRWVRSRQVAESLGETWPGGPVHAGMDFAANTHVIAHAGRTLATVEAGALPYELTDELDTVARATSTARCPAATPRTPSSTGGPVTCTPSRTSGDGTTCSTSSSAPTAGSAVRPTSPSPTGR